MLATCFDFCESSSGINIQELLVHIVLQFLCLSRTIAIGIPLCITKPGLSPGFVMHKGIPIAIFRLRHKKTVRQYVLVVLEY